MSITTTTRARPATLPCGCRYLPGWSGRPAETWWRRPYFIAECVLCGATWLMEDEFPNMAPVVEVLRRARR